MNRNIFCALFITFSFIPWNLCDTTSSPQLDDEFIKCFVQKINNPLVTFHDGEVWFFAKPSNHAIAATSAVTLLFAGMAGACLLCPCDKPKETLFLRAMSIVPALGAIYFGMQAESGIRHKRSKTPYIVLSPKGILCAHNLFENCYRGYKQYAWTDIEKIELEETSVQLECIEMNRFTTAYFKDKKGSTIETVISGTPGMLPTSMNDFISLVNIYRQRIS